MVTAVARKPMKNKLWSNVVARKSKFAFLVICCIKEIEVCLLCKILISKDTPQGQKKLYRAKLVPRSRGWAKLKARSGQVRKFDFFDWAKIGTCVARLLRASREFDVCFYAN